ncbi:MAG: YqeG family HAD IIIA-type phosphatase [Lachnospiraceae bacterium]|nr:YqeG family HAD IIIA-type phosphatase [Lachnospiraceae bacterium]
MGILSSFYPDEYLDSTYSIDFGAFYRRGIRGVIFDIDNTLVPHDAPADERAVQLFERLHKMGCQTMLLSNNKEPRVKSFAEEVKSDYLYRAGKPKRAGYLQAMERMGTTAQTTLFVGDQLFTDVWGAGRSGIYAVLVKPIHPKEEIQIVLKRYLEKIVLYFYRRENKKRGAL